MTFGESKTTIFEKIYCIYSRDNKEILTKRDFQGENTPESILELICNKQPVQSNKLLVFNDGQNILWELPSTDSVTYVGVKTSYFQYNELDTWFIEVLLANSNIYTIGGMIYNPDLDDAVTATFAECLKYTSIGDQWELGGSEQFQKNVSFYTQRNLPIEAVLPAFPCKSSNPDKVGGWKPDKGEELALTKIMAFAEMLKSVYEPGIIIWIVSDGHVFSDCINVDDEVVDQYFGELRNIYLQKKPKGFDCIRFASLKDIFKSDTLELVTKYLQDFEVEYHLNTKIDIEAEIYRKLLITCCDTESEKLAADIRIPQHPRLKLYRGFMKFMETDLYSTSISSSLSRKKYKKVISKIAFEMIKRNDAYSNLVELFFPFHVRFSIHAHDNAGPKFAVGLLPKASCKNVGSLKINGQNLITTNTMDDLLHIPTPWHNAVLKVDGMEGYFIGQSSLIKHILDNSKYVGGWNEEHGYFYLTKTLLPL